MMEIENELYCLKEEVIRLKEENEGLHQDRELAGELGNSLLQNNQELERKLEETNNEYISAVGRIEELKQENYSLRTKLETEIRANSNHANELDDLREKLRQEFELEEKSRQSASEKKLNELRKQIESLENDVSKYVLIESQLQEKIRKQEEMLQRAHLRNEELQNKGRSRLESIEEYVSLAAELKEERDELIMKVADLEDNQERVLFDRKVLVEKVDSLEEELQEKSRQAQTWSKCLQEARHEAGELKAELDNLKADNARRNFGKHGNSLFGEVEDRRLELEKQHASLQARYEGMAKIHSMTKQHLHRLKNQVATLLQVKSCYADASQIQRLTQALVQKESEVKILNAKISSLEKQREESNMSSRLMEFHDAFSEFGDKKDYVNFLQLQLEDSKKAVAALNKELQTKTLLQLSESDRLRHTQHQLHAAESKVERLNSDNIKLKLKIDELRIKLQNSSQKDPQSESGDGASSLPKSKSASVIGFGQTSSCQKQFTAKEALKAGCDRKHNLKPDPDNKAPITTNPVLTQLNIDAKKNVDQACDSKKAKRTINTPLELRQVSEVVRQTKTSLVSNLNFDKVKEVGVSSEKLSVERKPMVHFKGDIVEFDSGGDGELTTQSAKQTSEEQGKEAHKENLHYEMSEKSMVFKKNIADDDNSHTVTVKGQKTAPVVINVKKGETKNQCPQQ